METLQTKSRVACPVPVGKMHTILYYHVSDSWHLLLQMPKEAHLLEAIDKSLIQASQMSNHYQGG